MHHLLRILMSFCDLQLIGLMDIIIIIVQTRIMVHGEVTEPLYLTHHGVQGLHLVMVGDHELNCQQISKSVVIMLFRGKVIILSFRGNISVTDV